MSLCTHKYAEPDGHCLRDRCSYYNGEDCYFLVAICSECGKAIRDPLFKEIGICRDCMDREALRP